MSRIRKSLQVLAATALCSLLSGPAGATDHIITIGGGYRRSANQASLEANVLFFQELLKVHHQGEWVHEIYFADGNDPGDDLQITAKKDVESPLVELLDRLHRRGRPRVTYRNHQIPGTSGPTDPALIKASVMRLAGEARPGDRILIYVTSHGSEAEGDDRYNTSIDGWNEQSITSRELARWLEDTSPEVRVVMVMAQCYCGGFAHTIFQDEEAPPQLAKQLRIGFFAQQHDLAAAGCRPDIEHDQEFSSYFWGAMMGRSRAGAPVANCDLNGDGKVSFSEAYAYTVAASETIDIPLRASDVLLNTYSQLGKSSNTTTDAGETDGEADSQTPPDQVPDLLTLSGTISSLLSYAAPADRQIATALCEILEFKTDDDVADVIRALRESQRRNRRRGPQRRASSGRRELLAEIGEKWPDLADRGKWRDSPLVKDQSQTELFQEISALPSYQRFEQRRAAREEATHTAQQQELRQVKLRRLINTLENIVRAANLTKVASDEVVARYTQMKHFEDEGF